MENIRIEKYSPEYKNVWDDFVANSRNGTFLFRRNFMEYHQDRFQDYSLLFYLNNKLRAVLPGNISGSVFYSHEGLTYGGFILHEKTKTRDILDIFAALKTYLHKLQIREIIYKTIPHIYHKSPTEEDLYALFINKAELVSRSISSCINLKKMIAYSGLRKRNLKRNLHKGFLIEESHSFDQFWNILSENLLEKYDTSPTHTLDEITLLRSTFPDNIKLYQISKDGVILAGCITFDSLTTRHLQYISATKKGKQQNALDTLIDHIILSSYNSFVFFDFGTSTEDRGLYLNENLIRQKENFGARGVVYDTYKITTE